MILVSHSMEDIAKYAARIVVMNQGEVLYNDTPRKVFAHYQELEQVGQWLYEIMKQGDCVLFKGSNSMKLSQAVRGLEEWKGREGS